MQNMLTFQFADQELPGRNAGDELLSMLALYTGSLWRMTAEGIAQEIMAPFRQAHFQVEVDGNWQTYWADTPLPLCLRAEFTETPPDEIRHRLLSTLDLIQDGVAHQASRFFAARLGKP